MGVGSRNSPAPSGLRWGGELGANLLSGGGSFSQGLSEECQYLFQPQLIVQRLVGIWVLYPGFFIDQMIPARNRSVLYK